MVAQLAVESALRKALRDKLVAALNEFQPDILAAHSLGTLYHLRLFGMTERKGYSSKWRLHHVRLPNKQSICTQRLFPGQIQVPNVRFWYHLFNPQDPVLTAPIQIGDAGFCRCRPLSSGHSPTRPMLARLFRSPKHEKCRLDRFGASTSVVHSPDR